MEIAGLALLMGLASSLHCVVMCGPLMLGFSAGAKWSFSLRYQAGRILMYSLLGLAAGLLGSGFSAFTAQKNLAMVTGLLLFAGASASLIGYRFKRFQQAQASISSKLFKYLAPWQSGWAGPTLLGMLNGLIPCGMVYAALAAAINTGQPGSGWLFMACFGLATLPLTFAVMIGGQQLKGRLRICTGKIMPMLLALLGLLMLLRAADLDIPYLSPDNRWHQTTAPVCK